jgi:cytochrome c55X
MARPAAALALGLALAAPGLPAGALGPGDAARLERLVRQDCGSCHGMTLRGGLGLPLTPEALAGWRPADLATVILDGVPGAAMPPWWPILSPEEARWIADYLLTETTP